MNPFHLLPWGSKCSKVETVSNDQEGRFGAHMHKFLGASVRLFEERVAGQNGIVEGNLGS